MKLVFAEKNVMENQIIFAEPQTAGVEKVERFVSLEAGTYWSATTRQEIVGSVIEVGFTYLLLKIDLVDNTPHTIHLRHRPSDRKERGYKFLVNDFLNNFELCWNAAEIRAKEMAEIQGTIQDLQNDLMQAQVNPALMAPAVDAAVQAWEARTAAEDAKTAGPDNPTPGKALSLPSRASGTSIGFIIENRLTDTDVKAMHRIAERESIVAKARASWIEGKTRDISTAIAAIAPFYEEHAAVALAKTSGIVEYAKEIMSGIRSLNLYTGQGVEVVTLKSGKSAPENEPLTLMQAKLIMEEELSVWMDVDDSFDITRVPEFDETVSKHESFLNQILPTPRCVVSMATRRSDMNYSDSYSNFAMNKANKAVFLLVRDGENIYRVWSGEPTHEMSPRLFPTRDETDAPFHGIDGTQINFNDIRYTESLAKSKNISLHYKRFLILLCGLDHRLNLFGHFYPGQQSLNFISMEFQRQYMRFIADDEASMLLGAEKPGVMEWIKEKNSFLQSGSRVLCYHSDLFTPDTAPACIKWNRHSRLDTYNVYAYSTEQSAIKVSYRAGQELFVDVEVKRDTYRDVERPIFDAKVNLSKAKKGFLCLDSVSISEIEHYIFNRSARIQHVNYIRLFKRVAKYLREQDAAQAESIQYLRRAVVENNVCSDAVADDVVNEAVISWRAANRGEMLPSVDNKVAFTKLLDRIYSSQKMMVGLLESVDDYIEEHELTPLKLTLTGKNRIRLYVIDTPDQRIARVTPWRWVKRITLNVLKSKLTEASNTRVWLLNKPDASESELKTWPELTKWINREGPAVNLEKTAAQLKVIDESIMNFASDFPGKGLGIDQTAFELLLAEKKRLSREFDITHRKNRSVQFYRYAIPIALKIGKEGSIFYGYAPKVESLVLYFGNKEQINEFTTHFLSEFADKDAGYRRLHVPYALKVARFNKLISGDHLINDALVWHPDTNFSHGPKVKRVRNGESYYTSIPLSPNHVLKKLNDMLSAVEKDGSPASGALLISDFFNGEKSSAPERVLRGYRASQR